MTSIPVSSIVNVSPGVIAAGGTALELPGLCLTANAQIPVGAVLAFSTQSAVAQYFGPASAEAALAVNYFLGFNNSFVKPALMLFARYQTANAGAYLRGASVSSLTLAELQALVGTLSVVIDGVTKTSGTITLSGASSFSAAANLMAVGLGAYGPPVAVVTGSIASTTLTVTAVTSGIPLAVGQTLSGTNVTAGTRIVAILTGTGGVGTYTVSASQTTASTAITAAASAVSYDSVSGAFVVVSPTTGAASTIGYASGTLADAVKLTASTGAVLSQGAVAAVPATLMDSITSQYQDFASFFTVFEPSTDDKVALAAWNSAQNYRYLYVMWDSDINATLPNITTSAAYRIIDADYSSTSPLYAPDASYAAFVSGSVAAIDFERLNGRTNMAFRGQSGLAPVVTNQTVADQLLFNGYNFYGSYAGPAATEFNFLYNGSVTGPFLWIDTFVNQIWLNASLQLSLMNLLVAAPSIPYNSQGYAMIEAACSDPITAGVLNGVIRPGVTLSASQVAAVNGQAGIEIATTIQQRGWYLQIGDASPAVRAARGSPPSTFWYTDGGSVQKITLSSLAIQ